VLFPQRAYASQTTSKAYAQDSEEALVYNQTYGDVWTDAAKKFLEKVLDERASAKKPGASSVEEASP